MAAKTRPVLGRSARGAPYVRRLVRQATANAEFATSLIRLMKLVGLRRTSRLLRLLEVEFGHQLSWRKRLPVDKRGAPLPWYTYPAIEYLQQLDFSDCEVFEFGAGNGSLFWAERARRVVSVESDARWCEFVRQAGRPNLEIRLVEDLTRYPQAIGEEAGAFRVIVVDGQRRYACVQTAVERLAEGGLIILDNADWYPKSAAYLRDVGLIEVDFSGFGPVNDYTWTTSLFLTRQIQLRPSGRQPCYSIGSLAQTADPE